MAALSYLLPLVLVCLLRIHDSYAEEGAIEVVYPRVIIEPNIKGKKILNVGDKTFSFTCTFEAKEHDRHTKADELKWTDEYGSLINSDPRAEAYTKSLSGKQRKMLLLMINPKEKDVIGKTYKCVAKYENVIVEKKVEVVIFGKPEWKDSRDEVTGRLGESLSIECGAKPAVDGTHVDTVIMFQNNSALPEHYEISGSTLFIKDLTMAEKDAAIRCTAIETHSEEDTIFRTEKVVKINLQYPPVFEKQHMKRYGILGRKVTFPCHVIDANPRVEFFEFFGDQTPLRDNGKDLKVDENREEQSAVLTITELHESYFDYKNFYCKVRTEDSIYEKEMTYTLQRALPPELPQVTFKRSYKSKIEFEIKEVTSIFGSGSDNPPVTQFEIRVINFNDIKDLDERDRKSKLSDAKARVFNKTDSNTYIVDHLHWNTLYTFDIRAVNEAGSSDPFVYNATTLEENAPEAMTGSAHSITNLSFVLIAVISLCNWLVTTKNLRY